MNNNNNNKPINPTVRNVMFTVNNPSYQLLEALQIAPSGIRCGVWQLEIAPHTGTPHIQGLFF